MPLIMWGRVELNSGIMDNIEMNGVKLLRAAACVTVKTAEASESNHLGDFVLEGISACNLATVGFLTPTPTVTAAPSATPAADARQEQRWQTLQKHGRKVRCLLFMCMNATATLPTIWE